MSLEWEEFSVPNREWEESTVQSLEWEEFSVQYLEWEEFSVQSLEWEEFSVWWHVKNTKCRDNCPNNEHQQQEPEIIKLPVT